MIRQTHHQPTKIYTTRRIVQGKSQRDIRLVERHFGAELADAVAAEIEHPRHDEVWRATPGQPSGR